MPKEEETKKAKETTKEILSLDEFLEPARRAKSTPKPVAKTEPTPGILLLLIVLIFFILGIVFLLPRYLENQSTRERAAPESLESFSQQKAPEPEASPELERMNDLLQRFPGFADLPEDAEIGLVVYNDQHVEVGQYTFRNGRVTKGAAAGDLVIYTNEKYLGILEQASDICKELQEIKDKRDFILKLHISLLEAMQKYAALLPYRECLGL